ncbi:MAG: molybdopterin-binding protein, partial [Deltaproteobacteria bacterium]|nr:molybdopterin-binding protein [Deltaproteobacteria bacterium]
MISRKSGPASSRALLQKKDLPHLRRLGKENLFVLHIGPDEVHEDDAAMGLAEALAGPGVVVEGPPSEGKVSLKSEYKGLLKVNVEALTDLCLIPDICCASRHNNTLVERMVKVADTRAIPLIIDKKTLDTAIHVASAA